MTLSEATDKLANALMRAIREHGQPNSFGCHELGELYGGPKATLAGRIGNHTYWLHTLRRLTCQPTLTYERRRFRVGEEGEATCPK